MTDLPRFTAGSLGPIGFNQVNEMMRRLDALRPFIESVELSQERTNGLKERVMIVYAKKMESEQDKYQWREVAIRDDDTVASFIDEDWDNILLDVVTRGGGDATLEKPEKDEPPPPETYAVSTTDFNEGFAICFVRRTINGDRRYLLVPLSSAESLSNLFMIVGVSDEVQVSGYEAYLYSAVRMTLVAGPGGDGVELSQSSTTVPFYDFGIHEPNIPVIPEGAVPTPVSLKLGSFFVGHTVQVSSDMEVGYLAQVPRLDIECEER